MKPIFQLGDTVYRVETSFDDLPPVVCPDCLGEKAWRVTMPSGEELDFPCLTCKVGFDGPRGTVPGGKRWAGSVRSETITRVELNERDGVRYFEYNYKRDGVGLYATREEAEAAVAGEVAERQRYWDEQRLEERERKMRDVNTPYGRVAREDLRDALRESPHLTYTQAQEIYKRLTGGRLPRKPKAARPTA
jgi:hypothetical protein